MRGLFLGHSEGLDGCGITFTHTNSRPASLQDSGPCSLLAHRVAPRLAVIAVGAEEAVLGHLGLEYGLDLVEGRGVPLKFHADQKQAPLFDALAEEQSP